MSGDFNNALHISRANHVLRRGGIIAYPTEGVWGLGCDPYDRLAVQTLLRIKGRAVRKGLILVAANAEQFADLTQFLTDEQRRQLLAPQAHPVTWLVPNHGFAPEWITGEHSSVAIRISMHPLVKALCERFNGPLVSTSANPQGRRAACTQLQVRRYFGGKLNYILPGQTLASMTGTASEIRDLVTGHTIRPGH